MPVLGKDIQAVSSLVFGGLAKCTWEERGCGIGRVTWNAMEFLASSVCLLSSMRNYTSLTQKSMGTSNLFILIMKSIVSKMCSFSRCFINYIILNYQKHSNIPM